MFQQYFKYLLLIVFLLFTGTVSFSQCNLLTDNRNITYTVVGQCAPTPVNEFTIQYEFISAQVPSDIAIEFQWNDPLNSVDIYQLGDAGFIVSAGDTQYQATGSFNYLADNNCEFFPTAYIYVNGVQCTSSAEVKTAIAWARDNEFGGVLAIDPDPYRVCFEDAVINAQFFDVSEFNCNQANNPTISNPNELDRYVQFVYGDVTTHNPAATILDLSLDDGGAQPLTDGTGNIAVPIGPRGTGGLQLTAAYFGPVQNTPFAAVGPTANSLLMNAPANVLNAVGNTFEVTMYNWNICNPYNGDPINPNYDEAIFTTANITIVDAPAPDFVTKRDNNAGVVTLDFCIGDLIYFDNETPGGGLGFSWEFFDDITGTVSLGTSTFTNPTFTYTTGGNKLIRLSATNATAQSPCIRDFDVIINVTPTLIADILTTDLSDNPITTDFCQDAAMSQVFDVRFYDNGVGSPTVNTGRRWEFYNETGMLVTAIPAVGFTTGIAPVGPFDQTYSTPGIYEVKYFTQDGLTLCETETSVLVRVYNDPVANFTATEVCEGLDTHFEDVSTFITINGESIISYEWDFNYDGVTFTKNGAFDNMTSFDHNLGVANTYNVALRVVTDQRSCENIFAQNVFVRPQPVSTFLIDQNAGCSVLPIEFTNTGHALQSATMKEYVWQIDFSDGAGFIDYEMQDPLDASFATVFVRNFTNTSSINQIIEIRLKSINEFDCEVTSATQSVTIYPAPQAGYASLDYDPFAGNCGSANVNFEVDAATQALVPSGYTWRVTDDSGALLQPDVVKLPADPTFSFLFSNTSSVDVMDFDVRLTADFVGGCPDDSTRTIRVNPIPSATFVIDTLVFNCESMILQMEADQKGLNEYAWEIRVNGVIVFSSTTLGDQFDRSFDRPAAGSSDLNVEISLQATNFANCQSPIEQLSIIIPDQEDISADFNPTPLIQTLPDRTVTLNNVTNAGTWTYLWDFGDGQTSDDPNVLTHEYDTYGDYIITLTVNSMFCTEIVTQSITINPIPPIVDFDFIPEDGCSPLIVQFTNLTQFADDESYVWDFGDGESITGATNPLHVYTIPGIYNVTLTASNGLGDESTVIKEGIIEVFPTPSALFDVRPVVVVLPNPIFTNNSSFGATSFLWDFGDGTTSTEFEPEHVYTEVNLDQDGNEIAYDIKLIASTENGCTDTLIVSNATIARRSSEVLIPNAFTPSLSGPSQGGGIGDSQNDFFLPKVDFTDVKSFNMLIFNKWGELLFESNSPELGWNGYYKGKLVQQDVYVYRLSVEFNSGERDTQIGDVTLIR